ncbi:hypothetical protein FRB90_009551, partial [Tulasnella sp. 427]
FAHTGISWEWGIVFVEAFLFFLGVEAWKWAKRVWARHYLKDDVARDPEGELEAGGAFSRYTTVMTTDTAASANEKGKRAGKSH